jgi:membrane protein
MRSGSGIPVSPLSWSGLVRRAVARLRRFLRTGIWDVSLSELSLPRAALYRTCRVLYTMVRALLDPTLSFRAAALTYFSVLSIVPFLAFAFSVLKGFGAYQSFVDGTVRPYLRSTFAANPALEEAIERILQFVERTDVSRLGMLGMLFLVYTSVSLLSNIEWTLNGIWGAKTRRPVLRQVTDYVTLLVIAPLLVVVAATFSAAAQSSDAVIFLRHTLALGPVIDFMLRFSSVAIVGAALFATYMILPNARARASSAILGASVAALLWQVALTLHVQFQLGVARYNALYSFLGAVPIFLVWTYVSWLIVLVGAQLAASHQDEHAARQRLRAERADQALKETLAVALAARIARDFIDDAPRRPPEQLAEMLEVPLPTVEEILDALVRAGLLARTITSAGIGYVPGRDLDVVRVSDLRDGLRRDPGADEIRYAVSRQLDPGLQRALSAVEEEARVSRQNLTLRELAALPTSAPPGPPGTPARSSEERPSMFDPKQPEVPA